MRVEILRRSNKFKVGTGSPSMAISDLIFKEVCVAPGVNHKRHTEKTSLNPTMHINSFLDRPESKSELLSGR